MRSLKVILWGLVLIAVGVILGLNKMGITNIDIFFDGWWTLFIIIPCLAGLFNEDSKKGNIIGIIVGILLLLACQNVIEFDLVWSLLLPIILVVVGISFIVKSIVKKGLKEKIDDINKKNDNMKSHTAVFSGQKINYFKEKFESADITAIFGGINLDLSDAIIKEDVVINASAMFGGIEIYLPENVNIKINSSSIFGGVNNKIKKTKENKITVYINANCLFGGVEIK